MSPHTGKREIRIMNNIKAIVYKSNAGHTRRYAYMLGEKLKVVVYELSQAQKALKKGDSIIYMGWLFAGQVVGYKDAVKRYDVQLLCGVGMSPDGNQVEDILQKNKVNEGCKVVSIQGGFDMNQVNGIYRLMMKMVTSGIKKKLENGEAISDQDRDMYEMVVEGKDFVNEKSLEPIIKWYKGE